MINIYSYEGPVFWVLFYVWFGLEIMLWIRAWLLKRGQPKKQNHDRGSVFLIMIGMYTFIWISVLFVINRLGMLPDWTRYIGYILMIAGMGIRFSAIVQLGRFFSPTVGIVSNQEIVQSGLYRRIRHPAYTGGWISIVGIGLGLGTWWGVLLCGVGLFFIYAYRISVEERAMIQHFGDEYRKYKKSTRKMFPGLW